MKIPVLAVLPAQDALRDSSRNVQAVRESQAGFGLIPGLESGVTRTEPIRLEALRPTPGLKIDPDFPAVPIGTGNAATMNLEAMQPAASEKFAVSAEIDVPDGEEIPTSVDGHEVFADPRIEAFVTCANDPPVGTVADVGRLLGLARLADKGLDGSNVAIAIVDGGIDLNFLRTQLGRVPRIDPANSWTPPQGRTAPFGYPTGHGTMCAFDALIVAPNATLLDVPVLGAMPGGNAISGSLSAAVQAYSALLSSWAVSGAPGSLGMKFQGLVLSNSWGMYHTSWDFPVGHRGRYCDNPNHPFDLIVSTLIRSGVDIVFAAGNCGAHCPATSCQGVTAGTIMGANAHQEVLTLAGCDTTDLLVGYSSAGPPITGRNTVKPDLTAYTHFLGSEASGPGTPDTGTSASCPVAAGCVAALRSQLPIAGTPPGNLILQLQTTARLAQNQVARDNDHGKGIIDPVAAAQAFGLLP